MDERGEIRGGYIGIRDGVIDYVGDTLPAGYVNIFDAKNAIVLPGFINAHTHVPMTLLRGVADDLELHDWLFNHIFPLEAEFTP
jgi:5-methylthioadenosine/S-adenosylhomocysteine deaminase